MPIKRLAILPARGGSKRIPQKNIKNLAGKPIIIRTIENIIQTNLFEKVHVSTEDKDIIKVLNDHGIGVDFLREKSLSKNEVPIIEVANYVVREYLNNGETFDEVWIFLPCAALLNSELIIEASLNIQNLKENEFLIAVAKYNAPIEWGLALNHDNRIIPNNPNKLILPSQSFPESYYDAGQFYATRSETYFNAGSLNELLNHSIYSTFGFKVKKQYAIDVDDLEDWDLLEAVFNSAKISR